MPKVVEVHSPRGTIVADSVDLQVRSPPAHNLTPLDVCSLLASAAHPCSCHGRPDASGVRVTAIAANQRRARRRHQRTTVSSCVFMRPVSVVMPREMPLIGRVCAHLVRSHAPCTCVGCGRVHSVHSTRTLSLPPPTSAQPPSRVTVSIAPWPFSLRVSFIFDHSRARVRRAHVDARAGQLAVGGDTPFKVVEVIE
jgi:hypothetical protein